MTGSGNRPAIMQHLPWRVAGALLLGVLVVLYQPEQGDVINGLIIPVAMTLATFLLVQNALAVALGAGLLAGIHSAPGSGDWVSALAYPILAVLCAAVVLAVLVQRFRRHIAATHAERWRRRGEDNGENDP
jgi:hypothetical protein